MNPARTYDVAKFTDRELCDELARFPRSRRSLSYLAALRKEYARRSPPPHFGKTPPPRAVRREDPWMASERHELWKLADALQQDLRGAQAKLTELRAQLAALELPDSTRVKCPRCGLETKGPRTLAEHLYVSHDGPLPEHWIRAEALAG